MFSKPQRPLYIIALTSTLIFSAALGAMECPQIPATITGNCTISQANSDGYEIANMATLTVSTNMAINVDNNSLVIDDGVTATLAFIANNLTVEGSIVDGNNVNNNAVIINIPDNTHVTLASDVSPYNLTVYGGVNSSLTAYDLYANGNTHSNLLLSGVNATITNDGIYSEADNSTLTIESGNIIIAGTGDIHSNTAGLAMITLGSGDVTISQGELSADGNDIATITLGTGSVTVNSNVYADANQATVTLGSGGTVSVGGNLYANAQGTTAMVTSENRIVMIGEDLGVYGSSATGNLITGFGAITTETLMNKMGLDRPAALNLTVGLGGLTVQSSGFELMNTDTLSFNLGYQVPTLTPLLYFTSTGSNDLILGIGSTVTLQNIPYTTTGVITLANAPDDLIDNGANFIFPAGFTGSFGKVGDTIQLQLTYTGENILNNAIWSNTAGIGAALSQMNFYCLSGELQQILISINQISNQPNDMNNALAATAPLVDNSAIAIWDQQMRLFNLLLNDQPLINSPQIALADSGYSAGDSEQGTRRIWATVLGTHFNQQMRSQVAGYRGNLGGIAFGGEAVGDNGYAGIAGDFSDLSLHANISPSTTKVHHYALDLYGRYVVSELFFVDGILAGGYNQYHGTRSINYGTVAISPNAKYHGWQVDALGRVGLDYATRYADVSPYLIAEYDYLTTSSYTEIGAGSANQIVASTNYDQFLIGAGLQFTQTWDCEKVVVHPNIYATMLYALKNATMQTASQFVGSGPVFVTTGATPPRTQYHVGGELALVSHGNWDTTVSYDAQIESDFLAQTGFLRWRYRW